MTFLRTISPWIDSLIKKKSPHITTQQKNRIHIIIPFTLKDKITNFVIRKLTHPRMTFHT